MISLKEKDAEVNVCVEGGKGRLSDVAHGAEDGIYVIYRAREL